MYSVTLWYSINTSCADNIPIYLYCFFVIFVFPFFFRSFFLYIFREQIFFYCVSLVFLFISWGLCDFACAKFGICARIRKHKSFNINRRFSIYICLGFMYTMNENVVVWLQSSHFYLDKSHPIIMSKTNWKYKKFITISKKCNWMSDTDVRIGYFVWVSERLAPVQSTYVSRSVNKFYFIMQ